MAALDEDGVGRLLHANDAQVVFSAKCIRFCKGRVAYIWNMFICGIITSVLCNDVD